METIVCPDVQLKEPSVEIVDGDGEKETVNDSLAYSVVMAGEPIELSDDSSNRAPLTETETNLVSTAEISNKMNDSQLNQQGTLDTDQSNSELCHHPCNVSDSSSVHTEQITQLIQSVHALENCNSGLQLAVTENCHILAELRATCALLEKKNTELEQALTQVMLSSGNVIKDFAKLSSDVTSLVDERCAANKDVGNAVDDNTKVAASNSPPQPTADERISKLEQLTAVSVDKLTDLVTSVDHIERDLQRFIRRHSIIIENLCPKEDRSAQEAFLVFVNCVLRVTAEESDIDGLHLIDRPETESVAGTTVSGSGSPAKSAEHRPRPILVTFTCYRTRMQVYKAWLSYRVGASSDAKAAVGALSGERGQGVCIREYLTAAQEIVYRAASDARHRRPDMITDCWTFRGRTFVRTSGGDVREFSEVDQMITKDDSKYRSCSVM